MWAKSLIRSSELKYTLFTPSRLLQLSNIRFFSNSGASTSIAGFSRSECCLNNVSSPASTHIQRLQPCFSSRSRTRFIFRRQLASTTQNGHFRTLHQPCSSVRFYSDTKTDPSTDSEPFILIPEDTAVLTEGKKPRLQRQRIEFSSVPKRSSTKHLLRNFRMKLLKRWLKYRYRITIDEAIIEGSRTCATLVNEGFRYLTPAQKALLDFDQLHQVARLPISLKLETDSDGSKYISYVVLGGFQYNNPLLMQFMDSGNAEILRREMANIFTTRSVKKKHPLLLEWKEVYEQSRWCFVEIAIGLKMKVWPKQEQSFSVFYFNARRSSKTLPF